MTLRKGLLLVLTLLVIPLVHAANVPLNLDFVEGEWGYGSSDGVDYRIHTVSGLVQGKNSSDEWDDAANIVYMSKSSDDITFHYNGVHGYYNVTFESGVIYNGNYFSMYDVKQSQPQIEFEFPHEVINAGHKYAVNISNIPSAMWENIESVTLTYKDHYGFTLEQLTQGDRLFKVKETMLLYFEDLAELHPLSINKSEKRIYINNITDNIDAEGWLYLDPTVTLSTDDTIDGHSITTLGQDSFVVAWCNEILDRIMFRIFYVNGTEKVSETTANSNVGACLVSHSIDVTSLNSSHFVLAYTDDVDDDMTFQVFDDTGTEVTGETDFITSKLTSISVSAINSTHFVYGYGSGTTNATYGIYKFDGTEILSATEVSDDSDNAYVEVSAFNSTYYVIVYHDDVNDDLSFVVYDFSGNEITAETDIDTTVASVLDGFGVAALNSTYFAVAWHDDPDDDASFAVYDFEGNNIVSATDIDTDIGSGNELSMAAINSTHFVVFFNDNTDDDATMAVYMWDGTQVLAPTDVSTSTDFYVKLAVGSHEVASGVNLTDEVFAVSWTGGITTSSVATYYFNGTEYPAGNSAPTIGAKGTDPATVYTNTDVELNITCNDEDSGDTITAYYQTWLDTGGGYATDEPEGSLVVTNGTDTLLYTYTSGNYSKTDKVKFEVWCGDGTANATHENTTEITVSNGVPTIDARNITDLSPVFNTDDININVTCSDIDSGETLTVFWDIHINDVIDSSLYDSGTVTNGTDTNVETVAALNFSGGDTVIGEVWCGDGTDNSSKTNTSTATYQTASGVITAFALNDTYINLDETILVYASANQYAQLNFTIVTSGDTKNYTMTWNGTDYTYSLTSTELGSDSANATTVNISTFWIDGGNYTLDSNSSSLSFDYATTTLTDISCAPSETYNSPSDAVNFYANYSDGEASSISTECNVTVDGTDYTMSLSSGLQTYSLNVNGWTATEYTYDITCANSSYESQSNSSAGTFVVLEGEAGTGDDTGGGGGGGDQPPQIETVFVEIICGDGICDSEGGESVDNCSLDCKADIAESQVVRWELAFVVGSGILAVWLNSQHSKKKKKKKRGYVTL